MRKIQLDLSNILHNSILTDLTLEYYKKGNIKDLLMNKTFNSRVSITFGIPAIEFVTNPTIRDIYEDYGHLMIQVPNK